MADTNGSRYRADFVVICGRTDYLEGASRTALVERLSALLHLSEFAHDLTCPESLIIPYKLTRVSNMDHAVPPEGRVIPEDFLFHDEIHRKPLELRRLEVGVVGEKKSYVIFPVPVKGDFHS